MPTTTNDAPTLTQTGFDRARFRVAGQDASRADWQAAVRTKVAKLRVNIMLDAPIIEHFKHLAGERGYQTLINDTLRIKITEEGEFLRWNDYKKTFEGMPSPLAQNERHIQVLQDVFAQIDMPTRLGLRLSPSFQTLILVSTNARIDRPKKFDSSRVVKADVLDKTITKDNQNTYSPSILSRWWVSIPK